MTGHEADGEPEPYLWGVRIADAEPRVVWERLRTVRAALEEGAGLPTEPDIILRVPGRLLALVEAKFGSPNSTLASQGERFGRVAEFLNRYPTAEGRVDPLNRAWIEQWPAGQVLEQLCRNVVFAQWLAEDGEVACVVNLVRECESRDVQARFDEHLTTAGPVRFRRATWEGLYRLPAMASADAGPLRRYLETKTNLLANAFAI
jgi:hypothetical protein